MTDKEYEQILLSYTSPQLEKWRATFASKTEIDKIKKTPFVHDTLIKTLLKAAHNRKLPRKEREDNYLFAIALFDAVHQVRD